jgi:hypothetical protein
MHRAVKTGGPMIQLGTNTGNPDALDQEFSALHD